MNETLGRAVVQRLLIFLGAYIAFVGSKHLGVGVLAVAFWLLAVVFLLDFLYFSLLWLWDTCHRKPTNKETA